MIYKQILLALLLSSYINPAFSENTSLNSDEDTLTIPAEKLKNIEISTEESYYILSECKQFAVDDKIENEYVTDYVKVCAHELTLAVKTAKYRLQKKNSQIPPIKSGTSSAPKLL
jgi:hypothetical protein